MLYNFRAGFAWSVNRGKQRVVDFIVLQGVILPLTLFLRC